MKEQCEGLRHYIMGCLDSAKVQGLNGEHYFDSERLSKYIMAEILVKVEEVVKKEMADIDRRFDAFRIGEYIIPSTPFVIHGDDVIITTELSTWTDDCVEKGIQLADYEVVAIFIDKDSKLLTFELEKIN
jgi:hypothetical protein